MPLTNPACINAKCPAHKRHARLSDSQGLYLEVLPNGGKYWRLKYRFASKEKRLALGVFPSVTLAEARKKRDKARDELGRGIDPSAAKQERKLAARLAVGTEFEAVARSWYSHWSDARSERHAGYVLRRLEADVFPVIGRKPIGDVTAPQLLALAKKIESRGALDIAKRALQTCGQVFRYAVAHGIIERNPAADVKPGDALKPRKKRNYARLDARELPELLRKIEAYNGTPYTRLGLKLMALTFVRTSELIAARGRSSTWKRPSGAFPASA